MVVGRSGSVGTGPARRPGAGGALVASAVLVGLVCGLAVVPERWTAATRGTPVATLGQPPGTSWDPVAALLPVGALPQRLEVLTLLMVVACALVASWAAYQVFRGRGRWLAAVATGPVTALALARWVHAGDVSEAVTALPATATATIALALTVRPLVHASRIGPVPRARALAAAALTALLAPRAGIPLLVVIAIVAWVRERSPGEGSLRERWSSWWRTLLVVGAPFVVATLALAAAGVRWAPLSLPSLHVQVPDLDALQQFLPPVAVYCGLAILAIAVVPLRWRGSPLILLVAIATLTLHDRHGPLASGAMPLVLLATAAAGWIWLAGSPRRGGRWTAIAAAAVFLGVAGLPSARALAPDPFTVAERRPTQSALRGLERGLIAPGDAVFLYGPWAPELQRQREVSGFRPDVVLVDARDQTDHALLRATFEWDAQGRRILSDSFDGGGQWQAQWVVDSGPLFWFVGRGAGVEREFTDLSRFEPDLSTQDELDRRWWTLLALERARFRRALGEPEAALDALPLPGDRRRRLIAHLQPARRARPQADLRSELPPLPTHGRWEPEARVLVEAAEILYAHGEHTLAAELFAEATAAGDAPDGLGALARWQLRAGEDDGASRTLEHLAATPTLRPEALDILDWYLQRDRHDDARSFAATLAVGKAEHAREAALRLQLLTALAADPQPPPPPPPGATVSQRADP